jgi:protein O-GlcNAc transferase
MSRTIPAAWKSPKHLKAAVVEPRTLKTLENRFQEGKALERDKEYAAAEKIYREILARAEQLHLTTANACVALGYVLLMQGKLEAAETYLLRARRLDANLLEAHINLGAVYRMQEKWKDSERSCRRALEIEPKDTRARLNLGFVQEKIQEYGQAVQSFLLVLSLDPDNIDARKGLASTYVALGDTDVCIPLYRKVLEMEPESWQLRSGMLFAMQYDPAIPNEKVLEEHLEFGRQVRAHVGPPKGRHEFGNSRSLNRKLKIGYLSADFRGHVVMKFAEDVITSHDKERFEVFCITPYAREDDTTKRMRKKVDHWRDISTMEDAEAAEFLRGEELDIIVDLMGNSSVQKLPLLGRRVAPVQMSWCGYSGTTGIDTMDYIIVDDVIAPPGERTFFVEEPLRLPNSYVCFNPRECPDIGPLPFERNGYITFGCMNNPSKINKYVLSWWAEILKSLKYSRMVLRYHLLGDPLVDERLARVFRNAGIPTERFDMKTGGHNFLNAYNEVDIALDSFPYNGTTTTCEALWMGVPVVTLRGDRFVARVGASLLSNTGMGDLVAENPKEYIEKALALAADPDRLIRFREEAREILPATPVYDQRTFVKDLEHAYVRAFERWCQERAGIE